MEVDKDTVEAFASLFQGRRDVYGHLYDETAPKEAKYCTEKEAVTLEHYRNHLLGKRWLGIHPLVGDRCSFAAIDLDQLDFQKALSIRDAIQELGLKAYICPTKHKGYRILVFFNEPQLANDVRQVLKSVPQKLQLAKCEIFPKQDSLPPGSLKEGEIGSFINLPCFKDRCPFLTGNNNPVALEFALEHIKYNTEEHLRRALEKIPKEKAPTEEPAAKRQKKQTAKLPCFEKMMAGVSEGCRDEVAFRLAAHLHRQGMPPQLTEATLLEWDAKYNRPAMGSALIRQKIKQAYSGKYGLGCLNDLIQPFCEQDCPIYRKRHTEIDRRKMVGGKEMEIMGLSRLGTHPASFGLTIDGSKLTLGPGELLSLKQVKAKAIETLSYVPFPGMKASEWEVLINSLLAEVKQETAPEDASTQARYIECIYDWLETAPSAERQEDVEAGRPVKKEDGYFFQMKDAVSYLAKHHRLSVEPGELYRVVKEAGGGTKTIRLGKLFKLWSLPLRKEEEEPQTDKEA